CSTAVVRPIFCPDTPTVRFDKAPADRQPQSYSAATAHSTAIHLIETVENSLGQVSWETRPFIGDAQVNALVLSFPCVTGSYLNLSPPVRVARVSLGVLKDITQHHLHSAAVYI